jgi:hypothetical protein
MLVVQLQDGVHGPQREIDYLGRVVDFLQQVGGTTETETVHVVGSRTKEHYNKLPRSKLRGIKTILVDLCEFEYNFFLGLVF